MRIPHRKNDIYSGSSLQTANRLKTIGSPTILLSKLLINSLIIHLLCLQVCNCKCNVTERRRKTLHMTLWRWIFRHIAANNFSWCWWGPERRHGIEDPHWCFLAPMQKSSSLVKMLALRGYLDADFSPSIFLNRTVYSINIRLIITTLYSEDSFPIPWHSLGQEKESTVPVVPLKLYIARFHLLAGG